MKHSFECQLAQSNNKMLIMDWEDKWPNWCRSCGGWGGFHDPGVYRYPDGSGEPPHFDECDCIADDCRCPRCGMDWWTPLDDDAFGLDCYPDRQLKRRQYTIYMETLGEFLADNAFPCPCCGWDWGKNPDDGHPMDWSEMGPCECELEEDQRMEEEWKLQ